MKRFISTLLLVSFCMSVAFSAYTKVPKKQKMIYRLEPAQTEHVNYFHGSTPITMPNTRNSGNFALVDSSTNGYGMVAANSRPLFVDKDNGTWFTCYRQYAGELTTHGQIGAGYSEDGEDWDTYTNLNYNGNPPWGGGGVGGTGVAQGRYPSALGTEDQPVAIWNEYTGDTSTGSLYGGRPYYAYDEFGWSGGSFSYPKDIDVLFEGNTLGKDLWVGSAAISYDDGMYVVNTVYNDWTRGDRYLFHSEAYEDGFIVFGTEQKVIDEVNDLVGGDDTGSFNTSPYVSFTPGGLGVVGVVGLFVGADTDISTITNYHTGIFKLSDDHGASWHGCDDPNDIDNGCAIGESGDEYVFIPDSVWDDLVATQFDYDYYDPCEGTTHTLDSFWSYYEDDFKVDKDGNPHFLIQVLPCESITDGFCFYVPEAGLYHFTADRDDLGDPDAWSWSFVMSGEATWIFPDMSGETYIWNNSSSLAFSADDANIIYATTNMATPGAIAEDVPNDPDGDLEAYCAHVTTLADYPTWSEDLYVIKSDDGGASWWNPLNISNTPNDPNVPCPGIGVTNCDPAETYPHAAQYGTNDDVYVMYQMPNWAFNEIGDMLGADFMNRVYIGTATVNSSDIPEYEGLEGTGSSCYADSGDITDDGVLNVLDIVALVNAILGNVPLADECAADLTGDGVLNVLDIVALVNAILGNARAVNTIDDALSATLIVSDTFIELKSDGYVQGIELELIHGNNFSISLEDAHISEYNTDGNKTTVLLVTDGIQNISKIAQIEGKYAVVSHIASDSKSEMVPLTLTEVSDFSIGNAFPNPFNPSTTVELELNKESFVSINIYNIVGQLIDKVFSGDLSNSNHKITWDASSVSSGVYFMSIQVNDHIETKKLMLVK